MCMCVCVRACAIAQSATFVTKRHPLDGHVSRCVAMCMHECIHTCVYICVSQILLGILQTQCIVLHPGYSTPCAL